jgi:hypothetical protein
MEQPENRPSFDRSLILPIGVGALSLFGICLLLVINQVSSTRTTVPAPDTATPFKFLLLGTEPGISTPEPEDETDFPDGSSDGGAAPTRKPGLNVTAVSGISSSGGTPMPTRTFPPDLLTDSPVVISTSGSQSPAPTSPITVRTSTSTSALRPTNFPLEFTRTPINLSTLFTSTPTIPVNTPTRTPTSASAPPLNAGIYDDTDNRLVYSNNWISQNNVSGAYLGTLHVSNTLGSTLAFRFIGRELRVFYFGGTSLGTIRLNLDGVDFDLPQNQTTGPSEWVLPQVAQGTHAVTIRHLSGGSINIDYVIIPEVIGTSTPTATSTP